MTVASIARIFKALADPGRLRVLLVLQGRELCACHFAELLKLAPSTTSKHLSILREAGLIRSRRVGRWIHYQAVDPQTLPGWLRDLLTGTLEALREDATLRHDRERAQGLCEGAPCRRARVLFLCTGNSCRSQMAEGWARMLHPHRVEAFSAGLVAHGLNPSAVQAMAEAGVDIRSQTSKTLDDLAGQSFDLVVTVCGNAHETCPVFPPGARVIHVGFDDPPALARAARSEEERLAPYRRVRDEIRAFVEGLPAVLDSGR